MLIREVRARGVPVGLASSSKNAIPILQRVGLLEIFEAEVDGLVSEQLALKGEPEPDIFLKCLELLPGGTPPARVLVTEDAIPGVQAGRRGSFGLVLGVDRANDAAELRRHGADWVMQHFHEITAETCAEYFWLRAQVA